MGNKDVAAYVVWRRTMLDEKGERTVSDSTINRELAALRTMLQIAADKWEAEVGYVNFREHMLREPEARTTWITCEQAEKLIDKADTHLKPIIRFALLTGLRLSNITNLKWKDVQLDDKEMSFRIKSNIPGGKLLILPITDAIEVLLKTLRKRPMYKNRRAVKNEAGDPVIYITGPEDYVFTYKGEHVERFSKSFASACHSAGIKDFRFHDLRHTAASWMVQSGVPIDLVKEILGHTQITTTMKYAHRDKTEKFHALSKMQQMSQSRHIKIEKIS